MILRGGGGVPPESFGPNAGRHNPCRLGSLLWEALVMSENTRREFLQTSLAAGAAAGLAAAADDPGTTTGLPTRPLGKTGVRVSVLALGGWHIGAVKDKAEAVRIMHAAIDEGL